MATVPRRARLTAAAIARRISRPGIVCAVRQVSRTPVAELKVPDNDWGRTMAWARNTPPDSGWLADPMHAVLYGTSLRVAGERDVFVEAVKDAAIGMYERSVAIRTRDRIAAVGDFAALTPARARTLGAPVRSRLSRRRTAARPAAGVPERKAQGVSDSIGSGFGIRGLGVRDFGTRGSGLGTRARDSGFGIGDSGFGESSGLGARGCVGSGFRSRRKLCGADGELVTGDW